MTDAAKRLFKLEKQREIAAAQNMLIQDRTVAADQLVVRAALAEATLGKQNH